MKKALLASLIVIGLFSFGCFIGYKIDRDSTFEYRSGKASVDSTIIALQLNKDFENSELVNHLMTKLEVSLIPVVYYYTEKPNLLNDHEKQQVKKSIKKIDSLMDNHNLKFLSGKDSSNEFKKYIRVGLEKIRSN